MKKIPLFLIIGLIVICAISCDPGGMAVVEITNKTPYDLVLSFSIDEERAYNRPGDYEDIEINKNETVEFKLISLGGYRNPNEELLRIIFSDKNTGQAIKEIDFTDKKIFEFIKSEKKGMSWVANFSLKLLENNDIEGYIIF